GAGVTQDATIASAALTSAPVALPWLSMLLLGAAHGINPGMGWLLAVALGLQEGRRRAVAVALAPLALGHALSIGLALFAAALLGFALPAEALRWLIAAALTALGIAQLQRHRHPRFGGMRVGPRYLTFWSFLVATAHGAGLMALPFVTNGVGEAHAAA